MDMILEYFITSNNKSDLIIYDKFNKIGFDFELVFRIGLLICGFLWVL